MDKCRRDSGALPHITGATQQTTELIDGKWSGHVGGKRVHLILAIDLDLAELDLTKPQSREHCFLEEL